MRAKLTGAALMLFALPGWALDQTTPPEPPIPQPRPADLVAPEQNAPSTETQSPQADTTQYDTRIYQSACPALLTGRVVGTIQMPLADGQCGLQSPVSVNALVVNGREIDLPDSPTTSCSMATTLADWVEAVDAYARASLGTGVATLATGPGYHCRLRSNAESGFLSEHGRANAIDIATIGFEDGSAISVLEDWERSPASAAAKFLGFAHGAACARFTTVLGPEANEDHEDHFHFDLGCHGQSCSAVICE